jgi:hypothetical protein
MSLCGQFFGIESTIARENSDILLQQTEEKLKNNLSVETEV